MEQEGKSIEAEHKNKNNFKSITSINSEIEVLEYLEVQNISATETNGIFRLPMISIQSWTKQVQHSFSEISIYLASFRRRLLPFV